LLAFLLTASQLVVATHSTAHSENELLQCVFCIGQMDSKSASVTAEFGADLPEVTAGELIESLTCLIFRDIFQYYHSRAPPVVT